MHLLALVAYVVGWLKGGHSERLAVAVLLFSYAWSFVAARWHIGGFYWGAATGEAVLTLIFGRLAMTTNRWWPFVTTAAIALMVLVHGLTLLTPITGEAAVSARIGLWMIADAALLAGVVERWLAGEPAVSSGKIWARRRPGNPEGAAPSRLSS